MDPMWQGARESRNWALKASSMGLNPLNICATLDELPFPYEPQFPLLHVG
jgi:hypothetical protein